MQEYGVAELSQPTMVQLEIPSDGLMAVRRDHGIVQRVFVSTATSGDKGHTTPRGDTSLKANWLRLTLTTSVIIVYLWYKHTQEKY